MGIFLGGLARYLVDAQKRDANNGILLSSGLIAGEGLMGIMLALLAVLRLDNIINLESIINLGPIGGALLQIMVIVWMIKVCPKIKTSTSK